MPSETESFGLAALEAMACGVPVIASPVGVNISIVDESKCGFLASSVSEWDLHLSHLLSSVDDRRILGCNGRKRVEEHYSVQVQGPIMVRLMRETIN